MDMRQYGSFTDNQAAAALLLELRDKIYESDKMVLDILTQNLSAITELEADELAKQLSEPFTPDDAFMFGPQSILDSGHIQLVSQLTQSLSFDGALEVAGQVAGSCVLTSYLLYSTMASHCEALGTGTQRKLSSWLVHEYNHHAGGTDKPSVALPADLQLAMRKIASDGGPIRGEILPAEPWMAVRLPPASPFDNFLRAEVENPWQLIGLLDSSVQLQLM